MLDEISYITYIILSSYIFNIFLVPDSLTAGKLGLAEKMFLGIVILVIIAVFICIACCTQKSTHGGRVK